MKKLIIILLAVSFAGCASLDRKFNPVEQHEVLSCRDAELKYWNK